MLKDDDASQLVHHDELAREMQPHLSNHEATEIERTVSLEDVKTTAEESCEENFTGATRHSDTNAGNGNFSGGAKTNGEQTGEVSLSATPVYYSSSTGETSIVNEPVVIRQANGEQVIMTRACCFTPSSNNRGRQRPLKLKHIRFLKGFSILAVLVFFPLGIPAMFYAFKSEKEFHAGILRGNLDLARKFARRSEHLIIFSVMGALLVAVAVFAFVERKLMADDEEYWKNRNNNRVLPTG